MAPASALHVFHFALPVRVLDLPPKLWCRARFCTPAASFFRLATQCWHRPATVHNKANLRIAQQDLWSIMTANRPQPGLHAVTHRRIQKKLLRSLCSVLLGWPPLPGQTQKERAPTLLSDNGTRLIVVAFSPRLACGLINAATSPSPNSSFR